MSDQVSTFELQRQQFATGLTAVAKSLRNCAEFADTFAKIVADTPYSPETAVVLQGASESGKGKRKAAHSPEDGEAPKRRKRNMKPKDPNAPKRPASSYILFQNDVRKELKGQHPNLSNSDLMGLISEQWKNLSHEQKETYNQLMQTAKAQFIEEKKAYDNRQVESEVADAAKPVPQKEGTKSRVSKPASSRGTAGTDVPPPRSKARGALPSSGSSEEEETEDDHAQETIKKRDSDSSGEEEEEDELPDPKNRSVQPKAKHSK